MLASLQAPGRPSPFANMQSNSKDAQTMNLQNLASMFSNSSTPLTAADLQKYQSAGLNMANFPSLPSVSTAPQVVAIAIHCALHSPHHHQQKSVSRSGRMDLTCHLRYSGQTHHLYDVA